MSSLSDGMGLSELSQFQVLLITSLFIDAVIFIYFFFKYV